MKKNTLAICEAGIMIALSTVLAMLKLIDMPYGGSVTFAQMLPILIYAYRHGPRYGMGAALVASLIQLLLGLENFSYLPLVTWYSVVVLGLLDYVVAKTRRWFAKETRVSSRLLPISARLLCIS